MARPTRSGWNRREAMSWSYRIVRHRDGTLALHEVYYDEGGRPYAYTE